MRFLLSTKGILRHISMDELSKAQETMERSRRSERRQKLFRIIQLILDGKIDSSRTPLAKLFHSKGPRFDYISPKDRGGFNYGYTEEKEMLAGNPWEQ